MTFEFKGKFTERKPELIDPCSFCVYMHGIKQKDWSLADKLLFNLHLHNVHGWVPESELRA